MGFEPVKPHFKNIFLGGYKMDAYKVKQLKEMLAYEKDPVNGGYGAHLSYKGSEAAPIQLDAGALKLLIVYYSHCG